MDNNFADKLTEYIKAKDWAEDRTKLNILIGHYSTALEYVAHAVDILENCEGEIEIKRAITFLKFALIVNVNNDKEDSFPGLLKD